MKLDPTEFDRSGRNAAITPARHAARHGASLHQIIEALAYLHIDEPHTPGADDIANIASAAIAEAMGVPP